MMEADAVESILLLEGQNIGVNVTVKKRIPRVLVDTSVKLHKI